jgi:hypothetical protein
VLDHRASLIRQVDTFGRPFTGAVHALDCWLRFVLDHVKYPDQGWFLSLANNLKLSSQKMPLN